MTGADHQDDPEQATGVGADGADADPSGAGLAREGLSWSWDVDLESLLAAVSGTPAWSRDPDEPTGAGQAAPADEDQDAELAEYLEAVEAGRSRVMPLEVVAGRIAESLPAGPGLAGWLAAGEVAGLEDGALAGMAASYRRMASWAQAGELAVVAELASRSAAADPRVGVDRKGRPGRLPDDACAEVSLALVMSQAAASWWTDLGVTLRWRLAATGAALRAGLIDLGRAQAIADATAHLDDKAARVVEARMLEGAGGKTMGQLRAGLRRAVIAADPHGAERRRQATERQAQVVMYPDAEGTASLAGYRLPGVRAAAAMARITALAQALKATGAGGGIDLLRSKVFIGLLLGTLPYIPPPEDAPPDQEPPDDTPPADDTPPRDDTPPGDVRPPDEDRPYDDEPAEDSLPDNDVPGDEESPDGGRPGDGVQATRGRGSERSRSSSRESPPQRDDHPSDRGDQPGDQGDRRSNPGQRHHRGDQRGDQCDQRGGWDDRNGLGGRPPPAWPDVPPFLQPAPAAMGNLPPAMGGLLDLRLPWVTLTGQALEPGHLGRLGPITPAQARYLAGRAARDPTTRWRVIVNGPGGRAIAVTHLTGPARKSGAGPPPAGLVGQVTVTISQHILAQPLPTAGLPPILTRILAAARTAAERATAGGHADEVCTHADATKAYRPTRKLWEYVTARDLTCRFMTCRQPATRCDLDHTTPFDQGGRTCSCNLGAICRFHHQIKGRPRWHLRQTTPGTFTWTTPTGRKYTVQPDTYAA